MQKHQLGEVANETSVGCQNMLGIFCAKNFENRTILTKVTVKNVGDMSISQPFPGFPMLAEMPQKTP